MTKLEARKRPGEGCGGGAVLRRGGVRAALDAGALRRGRQARRGRRGCAGRERAGAGGAALRALPRLRRRGRPAGGLRPRLRAPRVLVRKANKEMNDFTFKL